ncbi:MAG: DUF411 domain-containing protein [Sphingosinicella sp.]|uniref:DUF411 domain-containing protein n=1 Tax=Sphingosinicella sp. TaxID=1917971 RepID=UPI004037DBA0
MNPEAVRGFPRRRFIGGAAALLGLLATGCARAGERATLAMTVHRDPDCGCCEQWARQGRDAGFATTIVDEADLASVKRRLGVPADLASCHTALVDGLIVEGHVPFDQVRRLLRERPPGVAGLAVPGMPAGSPGMEMPDGRRDAYQVLAFDRSGRRRLYHAVTG